MRKKKGVGSSTSVAVDSEFACPFFALDFLEIAHVSFHTSFRIGAFFEVAYKSLFTQRGDNSLFPESKNVRA